ncbi:hypothetical protein BAT_0792 [Bacillus pumilus ATCC 7061]|nr:hypothetical protein BAT_0792 [Bacillus pumilus ATCC 7061]
MGSLKRVRKDTFIYAPFHLFERELSYFSRDLGIHSKKDEVVHV